MPKKKVDLCKRCGSYQCFEYLGKRKLTGEEIRDGIETAVFTAGIVTVLDFLCGTREKRPEYWKCTNCNTIFEE